MSSLTASWRLLPFSAEPVAVELATALAMLDGLNAHPQPALRWYSTSSTALVLGSGQRLSEIDQVACQAAGVTLHRRSSGGGAVLFTPAALMLDVVLPANHWLRRDDVTESYRWLGAVWVAALARLGLPADLLAIAEARADTQALDPLTRRACFGGRSPYEVLVAGRKLVGLAQVRRRYGILLQAGLYFDWQSEQLAHLLATDTAERASLATSLALRVAGLADLLPHRPPASAVMHAFAAALADQLAVQLVPAALSSPELAARASALARYAPLSDPQQTAPATRQTQ